MKNSPEYEHHWWRVDAICAQIGSVLFFPEDGDPALDARRMCRRCPVREQCLTQALTSADKDGIFGGFGVVARKKMLTRVYAGETPEAVAREAIATTDEKRRNHVAAVRHHRSLAQPERLGDLVPVAVG